jgi:hypothetical protein
MIELEKVICFHFFNGDVDYMNMIRENCNQLRKAGYDEDFIYDFFDDTFTNDFSFTDYVNDILGGNYD